MLSPSDLVAPLQLIATLVNDMDECNELCAHVHRRMVVINDKLLVMETQKTLPPDTVVRDYSSLVTDYTAFLTKHKGRPWVYRVVASKRVIGKVKNFQERINTLMLALDVIHIGAAASERVAMERFRREQERTIAARLTDDATVTKAVARVEQQFEALNVLMHELRKTDRPCIAATTSMATSTTTTSVVADDTEPVATVVNQRLLTTALDKVIRRSKVQVRAVPEWFCSPQDVEYETAAFAGGSFGTVHYGRMHDMDVVVKCLLVDTRENANATKQFRDEATLWFGFRHCHVLLMYSACDVSSPPFIVCELAANGNLFNFLSFEHNKPRTFRLLHQAALGLAYLHANRVVHGDLKGDNILVSADECVKIADFSFSYVRAMSASRHSMAQTTAAGGNSRRAGAIRWRAPECLKGRSPTFASDLFSFGMCILEVVSQSVPWGYRVDDDTVRFLAMTGELPERPSDMTDRVWNLVTRMCSFDPDNRPSLASVTSELSELAKDVNLVTDSGSAKVETDSLVSDVTTMSISGSDETAIAVANVASSGPLSAVSTQTTFEQAITHDDVACTMRILSSAASINAPVDGWDAPPLFVAVATGATKVTKMLLARGVDASARLTAASPRLQDLDDTGVTALHIAARAGHTSVIVMLLTAKPDLVGVLTTKKHSALHFAVQFGHIDVIEELLRHGACIEEIDKYRQTPLYWAAMHGQVDTARVLLAHGASVHAKRSSDDATALHEAVGKGHVAVIEELLSHGARIEEPNNDGCTPLYWAASSGRAESARVLLAHGASVHAKNSNSGDTALHRAVTYGHGAVIEELLSHGAHIEEPNNDGYAPLYLAAIQGQTESARVLLEHNANVHAKRSTDGTTALHRAVAKGHIAVIEVLLCRGARINELDKYRQTPLYWSATFGQVESTRVLLARMANVHARKSSNGATALHQAVAKGHIAVIVELLRHGARINDPDNDGATPLIWSAMHGQIGSTRVLLSRKANVHVKRSSDGFTALHQAAVNGHVAIAEALVGAGAEVTRDDLKAAKKTGRVELVRLLKPLAASRLGGLFG